MILNRLFWSICVFNRVIRYLGLGGNGGAAAQLGVPLPSTAISEALFMILNRLF